MIQLDATDVEETAAKFEVPLNGVELALVTAAMETMWGWQVMATPQATLPARDRKVAQKVVDDLYEVRRVLLIEAGIFMPPVTLPLPPEYAHKQAAIQAAPSLPEEELRVSICLLRLCHQGLVEIAEAGDEDEEWTAWDGFRSQAREFVGDLEPVLDDLLRLADKLEAILLTSPVSRSPREKPSFALLDWPPQGSIEVSLNGVEWAVLTGALDVAYTWLPRGGNRARPAATVRALAERIERYISGEHSSGLRAANILEHGPWPRTQEVVAARAAFRVRLPLMPEHLEVCLSALRFSFSEFEDSWWEFCLVALRWLEDFNAQLEDLLRLIVSLEALLRIHHEVHG